MYCHGQDRHSAGFTLIELMIVVAIIGIIASVAMPSYRNYINTGNMTKVKSHYEEAKRQAKSSFVKGHVQHALNQTVTVPTTTSEWIEVFNSTERQAPGGGNAYITGAAVDSTGQVGITASGTFPNSQIVLSMPAYVDLLSETVTILAASQQ